MFSNQLTVIKKTAIYLIGQKENCIQAFKKLTDSIKGEKPQCVVMLMMHEFLEAYVRIDNEIKFYPELEGALNNDEMEKLCRYDYDENIPLEDYLYWNTTDFQTELFEMWLAQCYHESGISSDLDIPFYYMGDHEADDIFRLNDCKKIKNKKAFKLTYDLKMENNSMESPLVVS